MSIIFQYGNGAAVVPATVTEHLKKASKNDLAVLLTLAADRRLADEKDPVAALSAKTGIPVSDVQASLSFWRGTGLIAVGETEQAAPATAPVEKAVAAPTVVTDKGLPVYTSAELADIIDDKSKNMKALIDACQHVIGKVFNAAEVGTIAGMVDYLGLDGEYVLVLLTHCVKIGKKSMRYIEKTALSLYDGGITDAEALAAYLHRIEARAEIEGKIRALYGMGDRKLSQKEKKIIETWIGVMQYGMDMIELAFEANADATHDPNLAYTDSILQRWHAAGYRTPADAERDMAEYRRKKQGEKSFDADDFFEAAVRRAYGEKQ